jgi:chromosome segregation ATPase
MTSEPVEMLPDSSNITPQSSKQIINKILKEEAPPQQHVEINAFKTKIKEQAMQLQALEEYKQLCEKRIKEIAPDHPLPIERAHIGKKVSAPKHSQNSPQKNKLIQDLRAELNRKNEEIGNIQKKINSQSDYGEQFKQMEDQKAQMELSLRAEILANEEQRNYIEILKEAMEAKIESLGLGQILEQFCKQKDEKIDIFSQFMLIQSKTEEYNKLVQNTEGTRGELEKQLNDYCQEVKRIRAELMNTKDICIRAQNDAEKATAALQSANSKVQQLTEQNEKIFRENKSTSTQISEIQNNLNTSLQEQNKLRNQLTQTETKLNKSNEEKESLTANCQEMVAQITDLQKQVQLAMESNKEYEDKNNEQQNSINEYDTQLNKLKDENQEYADINSQLNERLGQSDKENSAIKHELEDLKKHANSTVSDINAKFEENQKQLLEITNSHTVTLAENEKLKSELNNFTKQVAKLTEENKQVEALLQKEKSIKEQTEQMCKASFNKLASEKEELTLKYEKSIKESEIIKADCLEANQIKSNLELELESYKAEKDKIAKEFETSKIENVSLYQDNTKLRNQVISIKKDILEQQEKHEAQINEFKAIQDHLDEINATNALSEEKEKSNEEQIFILNNEIAEREKRIEKNLQDIDECKQKLVNVMS